LYPALVIKGEESAERTDQVESSVNFERITQGVKTLVKPDELSSLFEERIEFVQDLHKQGVFTPKEISDKEFESFNTENAVVWIDPLDGTSDYCRGNISAVTVLIGLTINDVSRAGIVHIPFVEGKEHGETLFGTGEHGVFRVEYLGRNEDEKNAERVPDYLPPYSDEPNGDSEMRIAVSSNRPPPQK
jgi:3'-phosphoadenosine 5'-phosphosulfate (PAPS) 3'-phosphatase